MIDRTKNAQIVCEILETLRARPDGGSGRTPHTKKLARYVLPNGKPVVVQNETDMATFWLAEADASSIFDSIATVVPYMSDQKRHSGLKQITAWEGLRMVRIVMDTMDRTGLENAFCAVAGPRLPRLA